MDISQILEILREFGPLGLMFIISIWIFYKTYDKHEEDTDKLEDKNKQLLNHILESLENNKKVIHDKGIEKRKEIIYKCNELAKDILIRTNADNVVIYDYCNGTQNLSGLPFLHFRRISEKSLNSNCNLLNDKLDVSTLGVFLLDLEKENIITIKNIKREEEKYPELANFLGLKKQYKGVFANIVGYNSSVGFISITFSHNKRVDYDNVEKIIFESVQKLSTLLEYNGSN